MLKIYPDYHFNIKIYPDYPSQATHLPNRDISRALILFVFHVQSDGETELEADRANFLFVRYSNLLCIVEQKTKMLDATKPSFRVCQTQIAENDAPIRR